MIIRTLLQTGSLCSEGMRRLQRRHNVGFGLALHACSGPGNEEIISVAISLNIGEQIVILEQNSESAFV